MTPPTDTGSARPVPGQESPEAAGQENDPQEGQRSEGGSGFTDFELTVPPIGCP